MRFSSPVWFFRRTATRDVTVRDVEIAAGDKVIVWFAAGNRDPDHYPDPHRLDVARNPTDHLTFGRGGPHQCLGRPSRAAGARAYTSRSWSSASSGSSWPASRCASASNFTNGLKRLPVRVTLA